MSDYEIGKGKPPKDTRFKPGQSGNPNGRPKGQRNLKTEIEEILNAPVAITENGRSRNVTSRAAALMKLRKKALQGDGRALDRFLEIARDHAAEQTASARERKLSGFEDEILARYVESKAGRVGQEPTADVEEPEVRDEQPG